MIKNKNEILLFIRDHPEASKRQTAKKFKISTVTVSRFRKEVAEIVEAPKKDHIRGRIKEEAVLSTHLKKDNIGITVEEEKPLPGNDFNPELESWTDWYRRKKRQKWLF